MRKNDTDMLIPVFFIACVVVVLWQIVADILC